MDRRAFLRSLGLVGAAAIDRKYFFAPAGGWSRIPICYGAQRAAGTVLYLDGEVVLDLPKPGSYRFELTPGNLWINGVALSSIVARVPPLDTSRAHSSLSAIIGIDASEI